MNNFGTIQPRYLNLDYVYYRVYLFFRGLGLFYEQNGQVYFNWQSIFYLKIISVSLSIVFTIAIFYFLSKIFDIRKNEALQLFSILKQTSPAEKKKNERWEKIVKDVNSPNGADWKLAIIEADKMLDDLLTAIGYQGESLGDKLLAVEKGDMLSLDDAWEAHKMRNRIAHESGFELPHREAKKIIGQFEKVFQEYDYI